MAVLAGTKAIKPCGCRRLNSKALSTCKKGIKAPKASAV